MAAVASFESVIKTSQADVGVLRVHPDGGNWNNRSSYTWVCTLLIKGTCAELMGTLTGPSREELRAILRLFKEMGIRSAQYEIKGRLISHKEHA